MSDLGKNLDALKALGELKKNGHITDEEFESQKKKLLQDSIPQKNTDSSKVENPSFVFKGMPPALKEYALDIKRGIAGGIALVFAILKYSSSQSAGAAVP